MFTFGSHQFPSINTRSQTFSSNKNKSRRAGLQMKTIKTVLVINDVYSSNNNLIMFPERSMKANQKGQLTASLHFFFHARHLKHYQNKGFASSRFPNQTPVLPRPYSAVTLQLARIPWRYGIVSWTRSRRHKLGHISSICKKSHNSEEGVACY